MMSINTSHILHTHTHTHHIIFKIRTFQTRTNYRATSRVGLGKSPKQYVYKLQMKIRVRLRIASC
jgi:hypothetical protein